MSQSHPTSTAPEPRRWLHAYAILVAVATLFLIVAGGLVTSTGSGLAVPDWPLSYGMVMPPMVGGIFYEHGHRMVATTVGILTIILAVWLQKREPRRWLRRLGWGALAAVIAQGVLGGMTVLFLLPTPVSVMHACLAQAFFLTTVTIAVVTSPAWHRFAEGTPAFLVRDADRMPRLLTIATITTATIYMQLILGAVMRHTGSGLAIPDFPFAFGQLLPPSWNPQIAIHFAHRVGALAVTLLVVATAARALRRHGEEPLIARPTHVMLGVLPIQILLGAITVWSAKEVTPTTAHVAVGALLLGSSLTLTLLSARVLRRSAPSETVADLGSLSTACEQVAS